MIPLRVVPIVEGHGDVKAVPILLRRIGLELLDEQYIEVMRPIRRPRLSVVKREELERAIGFAVDKLASAHGRASRHSMVLVLLDADPDAACELGPKLKALAAEIRPDHDIACVLANVEYETWFVAAADSLRDVLAVPTESKALGNPEELRRGKRWIRRYFKKDSYSETSDQPSMTEKMDLRQCRKASPSFDRLCRELEKRLGAASTGVRKF